MGDHAKFYCKPAAGEQITTAVQLEDERRSALWGTVLNRDGKPVPDALVLLCGEGTLPLAQAFTDEGGRFAFGPLEPDTLYLVRVYKDRLRLRELEIRTD